MRVIFILLISSLALAEETALTCEGVSREWYDDSSQTSPHFEEFDAEITFVTDENFIEMDGNRVEVSVEEEPPMLVWEIAADGQFWLFNLNLEDGTLLKIVSPETLSEDSMATEIAVYQCRILEDPSD